MRTGNLIQDILWRQVNGKFVDSHVKLPNDILQKMDVEYDGLITLLCELESAKLALDVSTCKKHLIEVSKKICESESLKFKEGFCYFGGPELTFDVLWRDKKISNLVKGMETGRSSPFLQTVQNECLSILRECCYWSQTWSKFLLKYEEFMTFLFVELMSQKHTFDNAVGLIEEIVTVKETVLNLSTIPNLTTIVSNFTTRQLAFFCRILSLVIFEPHKFFTDPHTVKSLDLLRYKKNLRNS